MFKQNWMIICFKKISILIEKQIYKQIIYDDVIKCLSSISSIETIEYGKYEYCVEKGEGNRIEGNRNCAYPSRFQNSMYEMNYNIPRRDWLFPFNFIYMFGKKEICKHQFSICMRKIVSFFFHSRKKEVFCIDLVSKLLKILKKVVARLRWNVLKQFCCLNLI